MIRLEVKNLELWTVLRIRDVYPRYRIRLFSIPDPASELSQTRIRIKEFKIRVEVKIRELWTVLRIRDVYPGSRIRLFSIPDPGSASKNLSILTPKNQKMVSRL